MYIYSVQHPSYYGCHTQVNSLCRELEVARRIPKKILHSASTIGINVLVFSLKVSSTSVWGGILLADVFRIGADYIRFLKQLNERVTLGLIKISA
jgi:hypothetical protein